ncbi:hypothetical protein [Amycolatopsis sp.]|uniref:hypothetical protein n=1 Tax=Amycolatopsis sp. TaxID=37632 RepID=UPI002B4859C2|nr:hypothetical protein [Amycolatopsis sp.]
MWLVSLRCRYRWRWFVVRGSAIGEVEPAEEDVVEQPVLVVVAGPVDPYRSSAQGVLGDGDVHVRGWAVALLAVAAEEGGAFVA